MNELGQGIRYIVVKVDISKIMTPNLLNWGCISFEINAVVHIIVLY